MEDFFSMLSSYVLPHWPFLSVGVVFAVIGQFMSHKFFTRARAYKKTDKKFVQSFWWWGRETLSIHPLLVGALVGLMWHNPESASPAWPLAASVAYFAGAGAASLFAWSFLRGYLKKKGVALDLPGDEPAE